MALPGVVALVLVTAIGLQLSPAVELVAEGSARFDDRGDGVIEVRGSRGWLRMPGIYSDFALKVEFRNVTADADGAVVIRSWTGRGGWPDRGYRVPMNPRVARDVPTAFLGSGASASVVESGSLNFRSTGEWQQIEVTGKGRTITLTINDQRVGIYEIEELAGEILFVNRKGKIEFRHMSVQAVDLSYAVPADLITGVEELKKRGATRPKLRREVKPNYTREAMESKVQGHVMLEAIVLSDGTVGAVRVTRSLDRDLDQSAIAAIRRWLFEPAMLNGKPVSTVVEVEMSFTLR